MRLAQLRHFVAIADTGSLRAAARSLGLTQPALTKSLQGLEAELGVVLLNRSVRGVVQTECGRALLARARSIDGDVRHAHEEIAQLRGARDGTLTIGVSPAPAIDLLPRALVAVHSDWPAAQIRVVDTLFPEAVGALREGSLDLAIGPRIASAVTKLRGLDLRIERLYLNEVAVVGRRGHPRANARSLAELTDCTWLRSGPRGGPSVVLEEAFARARLPPPACPVQCESFHAMPALIAASDFLALVPWQMFEREVSRGAIVRLPLRETLRPTEISLFTRAGVPPTPLARACIATVRKLAREHSRTSR